MPHNYQLVAGPDLNETTADQLHLPAGTTICEVEVDPQTGVVRVDHFTAVNDFGVIVNPMIVEGRVHGGVVQGMEPGADGAWRAADSGQLLTGSLDYPPCRARPTSRVQARPCTYACAQPHRQQGCGGGYGLARR